MQIQEMIKGMKTCGKIGKGEGKNVFWLKEAMRQIFIGS